MSSNPQDPDRPVAETLSEAAQLCRDTKDLPPAIAGYLLRHFERWAAAPSYSQMTPQNLVVKAAQAIIDLSVQRVTPQASSAERSEEDLVEAVSRKLQQDFLLCIGPNTRKFIEDGQERIPLSLRECYDVACAAVSAYRQVVRGE